MQTHAEIHHPPPVAPTPTQPDLTLAALVFVLLTGCLFTLLSRKNLELFYRRSLYFLRDKIDEQIDWDLDHDQVYLEHIYRKDAARKK